VLALVVWLVTSSQAHADSDPPVYVSCPGGYIAHNLRDCPPVVTHEPPSEGHGGAGGGLLGGLLGHIL
jgi:hypothetical protein